MPLMATNGVELYVEDSGSGTPIVFVHEFAGDHRSWRPQVDGLKDRYRCVTYGARGYPPSAVPEDENVYGFDVAVGDLKGVLDALGLDAAHVVGLSMGAYTGLMFALRHPGRVRSLVAASGGSGSFPETRDVFVRESLALADRMLEAGTTDLPEFAAGPARVQLQNKDRRSWETFARHLAEHSAAGSAYTLRRVQAARPSLYDFEDGLRAMTVPVLLVVGDEDEPCLDVNLFLKRTMPYAGLAVLPRTGHVLNMEDPAGFNTLLRDFFETVEAGRWGRRDPRSQAGGAFTGTGEPG